MELKNINPSIFKAYDIRGLYPDEINELAAYRIGFALVKAQKVKTLAVAMDCRPESACVLPNFIRGAVKAGARIFDLGVTSTPALFFAVGARKLDAGAIATASHNPDGYTGFKLVNRHGAALGLNTGLRRVALWADRVKITAEPAAEIKLRKINVNSEYYRFIADLFDFKKIKRFKLILDASDGAGADLADYFFSRLPLKSIKINFWPDDPYPAHGLNPMLAVNQRLAARQVKKQRADLGVIWDGDADRCILIDEKGALVHPYYLNCLLSKIILEKFGPMKIVIDPRLPVGLSALIKGGGGQPVLSPAGTAHLIKKMRQRRILFGCENSGHYFFNFLINKKWRLNFVFGDTLIPILLVLDYLAQNQLTLSVAVANFKKQFFISGEINFPVKDFDRLRDRLKKRYRQEKLSEFDGLSVYGSDYFFNLRPSHTEPLARLNIETASQKKLQSLKKELLTFIK